MPEGDTLLTFESKLVLRSHLMMRGRWLVRPLSESASSTGRPWLRIGGRTHEATRWNGPVLELGSGRLANVGLDILDEPVPIEGVLRSVRATSQHRVIADVLLDQRVVAGIGNLWRSEILFLARLAPDRRVSDIPDEELRHVISLAAQLMRAGRDSPQVYRRARRPCRRCASPIVARRLGEHARVVYWCPVCQAGNTGAGA